MSPAASTSNQRLLALDVMRGMTIIGMIIFNINSGGHYDAIRHAQWLGLTIADLAFPFFLFMMGITTYISLRRYDFSYSTATLLKILKRTVGICLVCYGLWWLGRFLMYWKHPNEALTLGGQIWEAANTLDHLRWSGVLVRLGICYGVCAIIAITVRHKYIVPIALALLAIYGVILAYGNGYERDETNILGIVDRAVLGMDHLYNDKGIDPEGVLSTIPSIAHILIGFRIGMLIFAKNASGVVRPLQDRILGMLLIGACMMFAAFFLDFISPCSKKIWSPTFVLATCGAGTSLLALMLYAIDLKGKRDKWTTFFAVFGVNPLFLYILHDLVIWTVQLIRFNIDGEVHDLWYVVYRLGLMPIFGKQFGDLMFACLCMMVCWLIGYVLYRKRIYIKL